MAGNTVFKCFRLADGAMKQLPSALLKHEAQNYPAHAWSPEGAAWPLHVQHILPWS